MADDVSLAQSANDRYGADVAADVSDDVSADVTFLTRPDPVHGSTRSTGNPTRSTGQPGHRSTGQRVNPTRSTGSPVNPTRSTQPSSLAMRFHTRRPFWWRVSARVREFQGNFGTYKFVLKFPTMWYIDLECLKFLQT